MLPESSRLFRLCSVATLRRRLGDLRAGFLVLALSLLGLYWYGLVQDWRHNEARAREAVERQARHTAYTAAEYVQATRDRFDLALRVARDAAADGAVTLRSHGRFIAGVLDEDLVLQLFHIGADGYLSYSSLPQAPRNYLGDRDYFRFLQQAQGDPLVLSNPVLGRLSGKWSIQLARQVHGADGRFAGVIAIAVSPEAWSARLRRFAFGPRDTLALLNQDGSFLLRSLDGSEFLGRRVPTDRPFLRPGAAAAGSFLEHSAVDGVLRQYAWQRLPGGQVVVAGVVLEDALAPVLAIRDGLIRRGAWISLPYLLAMIAVLVLLRRYGLESARAREGEARVRGMFAAMAEGVAIVTPSGDVSEFNEAYARMMALPASELQARSSHFAAFAAVDEDERPLSLEQLPSVQAARHGVSVDNLTLGIVRPGHAPRWHSVSTRPLYREGETRPHAAVLSLRDITAERAAAEHARISQWVFEAVSDGILVTDADSRIIAANPAFERLTGYRAAEVLGHRPSLLSAGEHAPDYYTRLYAALQRDGHWEGEFLNRHRDGHVFVAHTRISGLRDEHGRIRHYVGLFADITERKRKESELWRQANFDALTGLPNRVLLIDRLEQSLRLARRQGGRVALLFIDLDRFKAVNDRLGHAAGDALLCQAARRMGEALRDEDSLARLGGDEFVALLPEQVEGGAAAVAARLVAGLCQPFVLGGERVEIGGSVGIALFPEDGTTAGQLLEAADRAMYRAKQAGRSTWSR